MPQFYHGPKPGRSEHMADTSDSKQTSFTPGETLPTLGIDQPDAKGWARWGLPVAAGLIGVLVLWYLN
jgi:hypothetical protein